MIPTESPRVIVGGGITGLTTAYRLMERSREAQRPVNVLLLEAGDRWGGVIRTVELDGFLLEAGPDSFVNEQPWTMQLCERLGLRDELLQTNPQSRTSFVVQRGRLVAVPEGFYLLAPTRLGPFLATPLISPVGKIRAALDLLTPPRQSDEDESIAAFVRRRFGREILEQLAEPLISGMASGDVEHLSMRAVLPHVVEMERAHRSIIRALQHRHRERGAHHESAGARYGLFVSFRRGMQTLVDRLVERLPRESIRLRARVTQLRRAQDNRWQLTLSDGQTVTADAVCLAVPPFRAAELLRETDAPLAALLNRPSYASWITVNLAYRRADIMHPLDGFGFVVPAIERQLIIGGTFSHVKFPGRAPEGHTLIRAFVRTDDHGSEQRAASSKQQAIGSDQQLITLAHDALVPLLGITASPYFATVHHSPRSLPQYHVGHLAWVAEVRQALAAHPTLALAGNAFAGHGITHCVHSGEQAAEMLLERLSFLERRDTLPAT